MGTGMKGIVSQVFRLNFICVMCIMIEIKAKPYPVQ